MLVPFRARAPIFCLCVSVACALSAGLGCGSAGAPVGMPLRDEPIQQSGNAEAQAEFNTEAYDALPENRFVSALDQPQSTFAIDVDTAAYSNIRRMLQAGRRPPKGAVRLEELINYFPYAYPEPAGPHPLDVTVQVAACPWQADHQLVRVAMKGKSVSAEKRAAANLVFLVDVSGSMQSNNKLPLVQQSLKLLVKQLKAEDRVAIVLYAGSSGCALPSTSADSAAEIIDAIEEMHASGSTNGAAGIRLAYEIAEQNFVAGGINRVILCTDGDFNVGVTNRSDLVDLITEKARHDVFLTVLGFGTGNLKDSTMEELADHGNGNYAYIDSQLEARKVLAQQLGSTLNTIAKDVKIQLDFNPNLVSSYRLLGYENRVMANSEFRDDARDAGELGAGHTVTAFYEVVPASQNDNATRGSSQGSNSSVRASEFVTTNNTQDRETILTVNLRYKTATGKKAIEFQKRLLNSDASEVDADFQFATAVLGYGLLLRDSQFKGALNWEWVLETARSHQGQDRLGLRREFVSLVRRAQKLTP